MKETFRNLYQDNLCRTTIYLYLILYLLLIFFFIFKWPLLPPELPLFYSLPWGEEQLGTLLEFLVLPVSSLFFMLLNLFLGTYVFSEEPLLARILSLTGLGVLFLAGISLIKIAILIT